MSIGEQDDQSLRKTTVYVNGQEVRVAYKTQGEEIEIVKAEKISQQEETTRHQESQSEGKQVEKKTKNLSVTTHEITPEEMEKIREKVKEKHKQDKQQETLNYNKVEEVADRVHYVDKFTDHVAGNGRRTTNVNEFKDPRLGPVQNVETMSDYREHIINTMKDPETKCFIGQNDSDKNALFLYNEKTNTYIVVPEDQKHSATMFRPEDFGEKFKEKHRKQMDSQGQLPEIKQGVYELLPSLENAQAEQKTIGQEKALGSHVGAFSGPQPTQLSVDPTVVSKYEAQLRNGEKIAPIEVAALSDGRQFITEGHHRFVASQSTGIPVEQKNFNANGPVGFNWSDVKYENLSNEIEQKDLRSIEEQKGSSEIARSVLPNRRPHISAQEYIKNPEARKEVRAQAEERIKAYADELRQKGVSEERISKIESNLQSKLGNPATAYGIKEAFDLRDHRKQADASLSRKDQETFCDKRESFMTDIRTVKKAFGADIKERTPEQQDFDKSRASWYRHGRVTMATVKKQMAERNVPAAEQEKKLESIRLDLKKAATQYINRRYKQNAEQVTGQKQGGGGGGGHVQRQSMRHYKYPIFPRNDLN
ncbi:MAG: hypothetical protein HGA87_02700 [Desulfobulbaceae bacterium]|nr:hypothetical protein [Desulfobulbaceae bacterium]